MTLYSLQLLRFIAALLVLFFHLGLVNSGYKGVDVFFVISGFVMYYTLFYRPRPTAKKFIINRLTKIYLLYWIAVALLYTIRPVSISIETFKTLLLIPGHRAYIQVSWTLTFELYFYAMVGVVTYLVAGRYHKTIFWLLLFTTAFITCINLTPFTVKGTLLNFLLGAHFWEFLLGIGSGILYSRYNKLIGAGIALGVALICCVLLCMIYIPFNDPLAIPVYGILSFCMIFFVTTYEKYRPIPSIPAAIFKVLGDASYAMYLLGPVIAIGGRHRLSKMMIVVLTIGVSILFNKLIENNLLSRSRKWLYSRTKA